jgi:tetratricopeptide (TPR) repeat protein
LFVWDRDTANIVAIKPADRFASTDEDFNQGGIVNGVVPHPSHCAVVSYGLDHHAKLLIPYDNDQEEKVDVFYEEWLFDELAGAPRKPRPDCSTGLDKYMLVSLASNMYEACKLAKGEEGTPSLPLLLARGARTREALLKRMRRSANDFPRMDFDSSSLALALRDAQALPSHPRLSPEWFLAWFQAALAQTAKYREQGNGMYQAGGPCDGEALMCYSHIVDVCAGAEMLRELLQQAITRGRMVCEDEAVKRALRLRCARAFPACRRPTPNAPSPTAFPSDLRKTRLRTSLAPEDGVEGLEPPEPETTPAIIPPDALRAVADIVAKLHDLAKVAYLNAAATCLRMDLHEEAVVYSESALKLEPSNFKARYRLALAYIELAKFREALRELRVLANAPGGDKPIIKSALAKAARGMQEQEAQRVGRRGGGRGER